MLATKKHLSLVAALVLAASAAPAATTTAFAHADPLPPIGDADTFSSPWSVAAERNGTIDVGDLGAGKIINFDSAGRPIWSYAGVRSPVALAAAPDGLYAADRIAGVVDYLPHGVGTVTTVGPRSSDLTGVAWAADQLYVSHDEHLDAYDGLGAHSASVGSPGTALGQFAGLSAVAVSPGGDVYTAEKTNDRVQMFDWRLGYKGVFGYSGPYSGGFVSTAGIAVDPQTGDVYVSDRLAHRVQRFSADGGFEGMIGERTLKDPVGVAIDCRGTVYVADTVARRVLKFGSPGATIDGNLLVNGDFEQSGGTCSTQPSPEEAGPGWRESDTHITAAHYGGQPAYQFPTRDIGDRNDGGESFLTGGLGAPQDASVTQRVDVSGQALDIDDGRRLLTLSGFLGGHNSDTGAASVDAIALDASGRALQTTTIGPVTAADRGNVTTLLSREATATLARGTRAIDVVVHLRGSGGGYNYASADSLALTLTAQQPPARPAAPSAARPGASAPAPAAAPAPKPAAPSAASGTARRTATLTVKVLNAATALRDHRLRVTIAGAPGTLRLALRANSATAASVSARLTARTTRRTVTIGLGARARTRLRRAQHTGITLVVTRAGAAAVRRNVTFHR